MFLGIKVVRNQDGGRDVLFCGRQLFSYRKRRHARIAKTVVLRISGRLDIHPSASIKDFCVLQNGKGGCISIGSRSCKTPNRDLAGIA